MPTLQHAITFKDVGFAYPGTSMPALDGVTFTLEKGKTYALVGSSGAGKSTLLSLMLRFYDVNKGQIAFDGVPIDQITLDSLRQAIALVTQEVMLFDDTIEANIRYGNMAAPPRAVQQAAQAAAAHDFITQLPMGYDTIVGEQGMRLSGGQRQRVAIARALLKDAPILLLDEATSALDTQSERLVQQALDHLKEGRTCLIVAHRLSTVQNADHLFVLDQGKIVESGTHETLMAQNGVYATFYATQLED
jgi:subfamily B ATP-binding cassette protein MsbA